MYKYKNKNKKFDLVKILIKWVFLGIMPLMLCLILISLKQNEPIEWKLILKLSMVFSIIPYFALPYFFKLLKELWALWKEGNWILKIVLPMGMLGVVGRVIWMMINDPTFKK